MFLGRTSLIHSPKKLLNNTLLQTYKVISNPKSCNSKACKNKILKSIKTNPNLFHYNNEISNKAIPAISIINDNIINKNKNNESVDPLPLALIELGENKQQFLMIPINDDKILGHLNINSENFPEQILTQINKINNQLETINISNSIPNNEKVKGDNQNNDSNKDIINNKAINITSLPMKNYKINSAKDSLNDNIEDVKISENVTDVFSLDNENKVLNIKPPTGVTFKLDMVNNKSTFSKISLPFNASINGFVKVNKSLNTKSLKNMKKENAELSITGYICKKPIKSDRCAIKPECKYVNMAGKLHPKGMYKEAIEKAIKLREAAKELGGPFKRAKTRLSRDEFKKEKPCPPAPIKKFK